jgi:hypothetical protein
MTAATAPVPLLPARRVLTVGSIRGTVIRQAARWADLRRSAELEAARDARRARTQEGTRP